MVFLGVGFADDFSIDFGAFIILVTDFVIYFFKDAMSIDGEDFFLGAAEALEPLDPFEILDTDLVNFPATMVFFVGSFLRTDPDDEALRRLFLVVEVSKLDFLSTRLAPVTCFDKGGILLFVKLLGVVRKSIFFFEAKAFVDEGGSLFKVGGFFRSFSFKLLPKASVILFLLSLPTEEVDFTRLPTDADYFRILELFADVFLVADPFTEEVCFFNLVGVFFKKEVEGISNLKGSDD